METIIGTIVILISTILLVFIIRTSGYLMLKFVFRIKVVWNAMEDILGSMIVGALTILVFYTLLTLGAEVGKLLF